jgi:threonine dehydrogenase-like Zn-dependent dehydrogenase
MRILKLEGNKKVTIEDVARPIAGQGEVIIKTAISALCGSELHTFREAGIPTGNNGHEAVGTIVELGEGVKNLKAGDRVGVSAIAGCGECAFCARGQYTWCNSFSFYGGMHAEMFKAKANACFTLPDDIGWDEAVLITGDGMGVPYHTYAKIPEDKHRTVAVFGVGPIGLGNVLVESFFGRQVIAVDISPFRLELAQKLGAGETINASTTDVVKKIKEMTSNSGADVCIEAAGRPETALQCFAAVKTAGTVVFNGEQGPINLSPSEHFIRRDISAVGAWYYHFNEIAEILALYRDGLKIKDMITHRFAFMNAQAAYDTLHSGESGKVLLQY